MITIEQNGYRFDPTGHLLHLRDASMRTWIEGLLGDELRSLERRSLIWSLGVYTRYPYQPIPSACPPRCA